MSARGVRPLAPTDVVSVPVWAVEETRLILELFRGKIPALYRDDSDRIRKVFADAMYAARVAIRGTEAPTFGTTKKGDGK